MKKIRLDPESLEVLSFTTARAPESRGTVKGANTGYTCYATVGYQDTMCLHYAPSHWEEDTCRCEPVRYTEQAGCETAFDRLTC